MEGYRLIDECFRVRDIARPKLTPRAMDTLNESKKIPMPWNMDEMYISVPWNCARVLKITR